MRQAAAEKKQQAAALKAAAAALGAQISALHNAITTTKRYIENLISIVQRTDLTYAQQMDAIGAETQAFIAKINGIYNSFNDNFPLESKSLSSGTKGSNIASGQNDNLFMYIGSNYNSPSIVQDVLNKLLNMNPESVAKNKTAFYNGLPDDLKKQINISNLIATDDGFVLCTKPLNEIFNGLGYSKVNGLDVNKFYDDWYLYGISGQKKVTYSLLKMRELEHDSVDDIHDDNKAGTSIPFVSIDINLFQTNDNKLSDAIYNVTNASKNVKSVSVNSDILNYFLNPEEKGSYVVAETYINKIVNSEMADGKLSTKLGNGSDLTNKRILEYLKNNPSVIFDDKNQTLIVLEPNNLSQDAKRAILAIRSGNTSYNSFAAETLFHARVTESALKNINSPVVLINAIDYEYLKHAISSDSGIEEGVLPDNVVTTPYYYGWNKTVQEKQNHFGVI